MAEFDMDNVYGGEALEDDTSSEQDGYESEQADEIPIDPSEVFGDGVEDNEIEADENFDDGEDAPDDGAESSPNLYQSVASALKEDGILNTIDNIDDIDNPDALREVINAEIQNGIGEVHRRVANALNQGLDPDSVKYYENILADIDTNYNEDALRDESDAGVRNRQNIIYQSCIAQGMSEERAKREVKKSFDAGTDIEDALDGVATLRKGVQQEYTAKINEVKRREQEQEQMRKEYEEDMYDRIMRAPGVTGNLSENTRRAMLNNIGRASVRNRDGRLVTPMQKAMEDDPVKWRATIAELYTVTDGFKDFSALGTTQAQKQIRRGMKNLERTLKGNGTNGWGGAYRYANNADDEGGRASDVEIQY